MFVDRKMLAFSDSGLIAPLTPRFLALAYERYNHNEMPAVESDLEVLLRLELATPAEKEAAPVACTPYLQPTPDPLPGKLVLQLRQRQVP